MLEEKNILVNAIERMGLEICCARVEKILKFLDMVWQHNKKVNIVGTGDRSGILIRHIIDSLSLLKIKNELIGQNGGKKVIDIGTGAGFPGLVLSIVLEEHLFYLLDSNGKKVDFIGSVLRELDIRNAKIIHDRAEASARDEAFRETFDLVLSRAVSRLNILLEITIPFCKINGRIVYYKSKKVFEEIANSSNKIKLLGGRIEGLREIEVPGLEGYRAFLVIQKLKKTPEKYPRNYAKMMRELL